MSTTARRVEYELREAERYVGVDAAERRRVYKSVAAAVIFHVLLLAGRLPDLGPDPRRVQAPAELMKVQFLKPPAPPPPKPAPPKKETKKIARPDPTPEEPEPVVEEPPPAPPAEPAPPQPAGPMRVSPGQGPGVIKRVEPVYPPIARTARVQGTVVLDAVIHKDGTVGEVRVLKSASPLLEPSAVEALKQWRFTPGDYDVIMTLTVNYVLR